MKKYCENCEKEVETSVILKKEKYTVYGELIETDAKVLICEECGEEFFCEELDAQTLSNVYNFYRKKHNLLFPEEIKSIREQYGLSQRSFAKLLNWGDKTICRYENGAIQDKAHNGLLLLLKEPRNMRTYIMQNDISLNEKKKNRLLHMIDVLEDNEYLCKEKSIFDTIFPQEPNLYNGFKKFDYKKLCAMVVFFASKKQGLLKTKLLKLLNYSDMLYYKEYGISISGCRYVHLPYGPVIQNYDIIFGMMVNENLIQFDIEYKDNYEKHQVISRCAYPIDELTPDEIDVLERVYNKFQNFGSVEISNYSHKEKGYMETQKGEVISYEYAKFIKL